MGRLGLRAGLALGVVAACVLAAGAAALTAGSGARTAAAPPGTLVPATQRDFPISTSPRTGRGTMIAIFLTFGLITVVPLTLSINATNRSQNRATVVEVVGRQRTLAERYVSEVLLIRTGERADPALTASIMAQSVQALLH